MLKTLDVDYDPHLDGDRDRAKAKAQAVLARLRLAGHDGLLTHCPPVATIRPEPGFYRVHVIAEMGAEEALTAIAEVMWKADRKPSQPVGAGGPAVRRSVPRTPAPPGACRR